MGKNLRDLRREGFRHSFVMASVEEVDSAVVERVPLWNDRTDELGPFDIIGDVNGCADELELLLKQPTMVLKNHCTSTTLAWAKWFIVIRRAAKQFSSAISLTAVRGLNGSVAKNR